MNYEMYSVLPRGDSTYQDFERFKRQFGFESAVLVVGMQNEKIFQKEQFNNWIELCDQLSDIDGVDEVLAVPTAVWLRKNTEERKFEPENLFQGKVKTQDELDSILGKFYSLPFYRGLIYNDSSDVYVTALTLDRDRLDSKDRKELMDEIMHACNQYQKENDIDIYFSGLPYIRANTTSKIAEEVELFIYLALLITALILFLFFRSFRATFYPMFVIMVGVIWAMGWMGMFGYEITMLTGLIPPLIIVIGIPNSIFLLNKYHQEYVIHGNQIKALSRVVQKIGNAIFLSNFTTALGIAAFIFTGSQILVEFGIVTAVSLVSVFVLSITLIPIIFSFSPPPIHRHTKHLENKWIGLVIDKMVSIVLNHRKWVYLTFGLLVAISWYGISLVKTTGNISDDLPRSSKVYTDLMFFEENFNGVIPFEITIDTKKKGQALQMRTLKKIEYLQETIEEYDLFSKPLSIVEGIKFSRQAFYNGSERRFALFNNQDKSFLAPYLTQKGENSKTIKSFVDSSRKVTRIAVQMKDIGTEEMDKLMNSFKPQVDSIFNPEEYKVTLTGTSVIFLEGTKYLVKNLFTSLFLAILVISLLMAALFYSARMVLVSLIPNLIPLVVTAGAMGYLNIPLKPSTILIFSIAFGISIDDTIHYLAKFKQELQSQNRSFKKAVIDALRETGVSMTYTSIVLFFGFCVFTASDFGGTVALGLLVSFTLLVAMNANLILLPSMLLSLDRRVTRKALKHEALLQLLEEEEDIGVEDINLSGKSTKEGEGK